MSYVEPHHDAHFCHVETSECVEGCDCHLDTPDADGKPWDFCDPRHTLEIAWIQAPAFTQSFRKTATAAASTRGQAEKGKSTSVGASQTESATSAAKKQTQSAIQEAKVEKKHVKQVEKKDSLAMSKAQAKLETVQTRLSISMVVSGVMALCGLSLAGCMLVQIWRSSSTKQQLEDAKMKAALLEQENLHLTEEVNHLRRDVGSQRDLLHKHQDVVLEMAKSEHCFAKQVSRTSLGSMNTSLQSGFARLSRKRSGTESTMSSDLEDFERATTQSTRAFEGEFSREITTLSSMSTDRKPSFHLDLSPENLQQLPSNTTACSGLQQQLLDENSWRKIGEEAWTPEESLRASDHDQHQVPTQGSDCFTGPNYLLHKPHVRDIVDIDGKSMCSQRSDQTSNSAAWWGGTNFSNLLEQCPVSAREAQLLAKKKHLPERYAIHTPAQTSRC